MTSYAYDLIVVTGCSFSCGMEMNDHQLPPYVGMAQRRVSIWKWYRSIGNSVGLNVKELNDRAVKEWEEKEREHSWPKLLETLSGLPVINLAKAGASVGESLIRYSDFVKNKPNGRILAIHQLPGIGRMFMRFDGPSRTQMLPTGQDFGFKKLFFAEKISKVKKKYKARLAKQGYIEKHFERAVGRMHRLSFVNGINDFYIGNGAQIVGLPKKRFLIDDLGDFKKDYERGQIGHPIDPAYNKEICEKILPIL